MQRRLLDLYEINCKYDINIIFIGDTTISTAVLLIQNHKPISYRYRIDNEDINSNTIDPTSGKQYLIKIESN